MVQVYYAGPDGAVRQQLKEEFSDDVHAGWPSEVHQGDVVFVSVRGSEGLPGGNAFSACRVLKETPACGCSC